MALVPSFYFWWFNCGLGASALPLTTPLLLNGVARGKVALMRARRQEYKSPDSRKTMSLRLDDELFDYADTQAERLQVSRARWIANLIAEHGGIEGYEIDPPLTQQGATKPPS